MIVIRDSDIGTRVWSDPLVDIHIDEFRKCADSLRKILDSQAPDTELRVERLANHLCEMSRDLIYRVNRVTIPQIQDMIREFTVAVESLSEVEITDHPVADRTNRYIEHIGKRIEMLRKQVQ